MGGRSIEVEGSRSSKDSFFKQYLYETGKERKEKPIDERDNKRDVKMAALTNLLGNGITRLLGIRNLTWDDLEKFAGIKKEEVGKVEYKTGGTIKPPSEKNGEPHITQPQGKMLFAKFKSKGINTTALMNDEIRKWYSNDELELFKLPLKHFEDCKHKIDEIELPEPGSDG